MNLLFTTKNLLGLIDGTIGAIDIEYGGTGYVGGTLSVTGGGGSAFAGTYTVDGNGSIDSVTIVTPGTGYTSIPTLVISDAGNSDAELSIRLGSIAKDRELQYFIDRIKQYIYNYTHIDNSVIEFVQIANAGTGYSDGSVYAYGNSTGSSFEATFTVDSNGGVKTVTIINNGSGYTDPPALLVGDGGNNDAVLIPVLGWKLPKDLEYLVVEKTMNRYNATSGGTMTTTVSTNLSARRVGDIEYEYDTSGGNNGGSNISDPGWSTDDKAVLKSFRRIRFAKSRSDRHRSWL